jgi:hypothetical protein
MTSLLNTLSMLAQHLKKKQSFGLSCYVLLSLHTGHCDFQLLELLKFCILNIFCVHYNYNKERKKKRYTANKNQRMFSRC